MTVPEGDRTSSHDLEKGLWPGGTTPDIDALADRFRADYPRFQYVFVNFIADHLADGSRVFQGDLQRMLVLAIVGQVYLNAHIRQPSPGPIETLQNGWTTASRIADVTGIPRETVRRKLKLLEKAGWIVQSEDGAWQLAIVDGAAEARRALSDIDNRQIARAARLLWTLRQMAR